MRVEMKLALTFDDGSNKATESILMTLKNIQLQVHFLFGVKR